ncbi:MAG: O-methyltransferase [Sporichthyaceae bacterium]
MSPKSDFLPDALAAYVSAHAPVPDEVLAALAQHNAGLGDLARMQIAPEQGAFMTLLARLIAPSFAVEVGTFTGYSAICLARGLAPGGRLLCCDISTEWTDVARDHFARAGVAECIEVRIAPAAQTLATLPAEPAIDLAFIDADKTGYLTYWEAVVSRLRPGGLVLVDNTLWAGAVVDPAIVDADTVALRAFNDHVSADARVQAVIVPIGDGLTVAQRLSRPLTSDEMVAIATT